MTVYLSPMAGVAAQFFSNDGVPLAGGKIYTYQAGTTTPVNTYTTSAGNIAHTNPIILDSSGRIATGEVWLLSNYTYKFILKDANDALIATYDNITGIGATSYNVQNFTGDGTTLSFTLNPSSLGENYSFVYINGVYQNKNTYSIIGTTLLFSEAPPITSKIEIMFN